MWEMFYTAASNIGVPFEILISGLVLIGGLIFYAKDVKIGVILHFVGFGLVFMWFYADGLNYTPPLVLFLMFLVIMTFTLYAVNKAGQKVAVV